MYGLGIQILQLCKMIDDLMKGVDLSLHKMANL